MATMSVLPWTSRGQCITNTWHSPKIPPFCVKLYYHILNHGVFEKQSMRTCFEAMLEELFSFPAIYS